MPPRLADLPVAVDLDGVLGDEVRAYVEGEAGWQVVAEGGPPRPVLTITAVARADRSCVVVLDGPPSTEQVRGALLEGALDVLGWPDDRARLLEAPLRARPDPRDESGPAVLRLVGSAGGVGTSTLALACGGLLAWQGGDVIVVGGEDLLRLCGMSPWSGPGTREVAALEAGQAGSEVAALARRVPGVDRLRVLGGGAGMVSTAGWPAAAVVMDLRASPSAGRFPEDGLWLRDAAGGTDAADVLVARPDAGLRAAAAAPREVPVLVVGDGPLDRAGVRRALGRAPVGILPVSARVARAGVSGRVPSGLPGTWLAKLSTVLTRVNR